MEASDIVDWIISGGLDGFSPTELLAGYCDRLTAVGVPLWRASIGTDTLHPLIDAHGHRWVAGAGIEEELVHRTTGSEAQDEVWRQSPWFRMLEEGAFTKRCRLMAGEGTNEYPLLAQIAANGGTDYWARVIKFGERIALGTSTGVATSWTTREPDGFADHDIAMIEATLPAFGLAFKARFGADTARTLVTTYLGRDPAERILRGDIERGGVMAERKVVWFSDLERFTRMTDTLPRDKLVDLINAYSDCLVGIVHEHGGDVLKFMGDGILAVFQGDEIEASRSALAAAEASQAALESLNHQREADGREVTTCTIALHEGEVFYGNIGSRDRLDFTVVGPAVNEASRILAMSRSLDQPILVSESFAVACGALRERLVSVGRYALRGVTRPQELFTIDRGRAS